MAGAQYPELTLEDTGDLRFDLRVLVATEASEDLTRRIVYFFVAIMYTMSYRLR
jgi:hypothetical protein